MSAVAPVRALRAHLRGRPVGLLGVLVVLIAGVFAVVWGTYRSTPPRFALVDAGLVLQFAIGRVVAYPEQQFYVVGLADGRLRAVDGYVEASGCAVRWTPDDDRGRARNVDGAPGAYVDACSGGAWYANGDAIPPTAEPLRTFHLEYRTVADGQHLWVEVLGDRSRRP